MMKQLEGHSMCRPPARVLLDRKLTEAPKERQEAVRSEWNNDSVVGAPVDPSKPGSTYNSLSTEVPRSS